MNFTEIDKYVGETFKKKRESLGLTLEEISKKLKIPKGTYYYYEVGKRSMPFITYKKICKFYNLDYIKLFEKAEKEMSKSLK